MAKIVLFSQTSNLGTFDEFKRFVSALIQNMVGEMNGHLDFVTNIRAAGPYYLGFTISGQVIGVTHNLQRVPTGYLTVKMLGSAQVLYAPSGATWSWTTDKIYLQANSAVTATIFVI